MHSETIFWLHEQERRENEKVLILWVFTYTNMSIMIQIIINNEKSYEPCEPIFVCFIWGGEGGNSTNTYIQAFSEVGAAYKLPKYANEKLHDCIKC